MVVVMAVFLNEADERRCFVRVVFNRELGREPGSAQEQEMWAQALLTKGADGVLAELRDSPEAQKFREKRGW
jgi:hypothetical protein